MVRSMVVFGWFGKNNLGDDILLLSFLNKFKDEKILLPVFGLYKDIPSNVKQIVCYNKLHYLIMTTALVVVHNNLFFAGGSVFRDSSIGLKATLALKVIWLRIIKLRSGKCVLYSVSIGPLTARSSNILINSFPLKTTFYLRDNESYELISQSTKLNNCYIELIEDSSANIHYPKLGVGEMTGLNLSDSLDYMLHDALKNIDRVILVSLCENDKISDKKKIFQYCSQNKIEIVDSIVYEGDVFSFLNKFEKIGHFYSERLHGLYIAKHMGLPFTALLNSHKVSVQFG